MDDINVKGRYMTTVQCHMIKTDTAPVLQQSCYVTEWSIFSFPHQDIMCHVTTSHAKLHAGAIQRQYETMSRERESFQIFQPRTTAHLQRDQ